MTRGVLSRVVIAAFVLLGAARAWSHPPVSTVVRVEVDPSGQVRVAVEHDVLALALGVPSEQAADLTMRGLLGAGDDTLERALASGRRRVGEGLEIRCDGEPCAMELVEGPTSEQIRSWRAEHAEDLAGASMPMRFEGRLGAGARKLTVRAPAVLGGVDLVVERPGLELSVMQLEAGEESLPFDVSMVDAAVGGGAGPGVVRRSSEWNALVVFGGLLACGGVLVGGLIGVQRARAGRGGAKSDGCVPRTA